MPIQLIPPILRGLANIPEAVRQEGFAGVGKAFVDPQRFERTKRFQAMRENYAPEVSSIEQTIELGDGVGALGQTMALRGRMERDGRDPKDIDGFTSSLLVGAANAEYQNIAKGGDPRRGIPGAIAQDPRTAMQGVELAGRLPGMAEEPGMRRAQTAQAQAGAAQAQAQANIGIPAAAAANLGVAELAQARAANPQAFVSGGRQQTVADVIGRGATTIGRLDKELNKVLEEANATKNPRLVTGALEQRNAVVRALNQSQPGVPPMPEFELATIIDPGADPSAPFANRQQFALQAKPQPQPVEEPPPQPEPQLPPPPPPVEAGPSQPVDANAGLQPRRFSLKNFQAAVQNPLGSLPPPVQQAFASGQDVPTSALVQAYADQGYTQEQAVSLVQALAAQLMELDQPPARQTPPLPLATPQATPTPFQPQAQ